MVKEEFRPKRTQIMTLKEAAKYLGMHPMTIYKLIKKTGMPALKLGGQWRFKKDILDEWLVAQMNKRGQGLKEKAGVLGRAGKK